MHINVNQNMWPTTALNMELNYFLLLAVPDYNLVVLFDLFDFQIRVINVCTTKFAAILPHNTSLLLQNPRWMSKLLTTVC